MTDGGNSDDIQSRQVTCTMFTVYADREVEVEIEKDAG